ncbi:uncharacterized protein LOC128244800 [Mya arenaria]|uniref:uncharacterized protein LOC128244800 n=1 Tax=Mya arenaria TaxID=6604 RepID=UPI0022DF9A9B|nr:uncharacterized protein LOC128244800 [Mya arenaria]
MVLKYCVVVLLLQYLIPGVPAPGVSKFCKSCQHVNHPWDCHHQEACHHGSCSMEVHAHNGTYTYNYGCKEHHECEHSVQLVGRRAAGKLVCSACCDLTGCEKDLCLHFAHQPHTNPPPVTHQSHRTCKVCSHIIDPNDCHHSEPCPDGQCMMAIHNHNGTYIYNLACGTHSQCSNQVFVQTTTNLMCRACCNHTGCEKNLCHRYITPPTTHAQHTTHVQHTHAHTTVTFDPNCHDIESEAFKCAEMDKYDFCHDPISIGYAIAHEKCAKHCGFCGSGSATTTVAPVAVTTIAPVAVTTADPVVVTSTVPVAVTTADPVEVVTALPMTVSTADPEVYSTAVPVAVSTTVTTAEPDITATPESTITTTTIGHAGVVIIGGQAPTSGGVLEVVTSGEGTVATTVGITGGEAICVDIEDEQFQCADWNSFGFCSPDSGVGYEVSVKKCRKTCGLCV